MSGDYWQDDADDATPKVADDVVDLAFPVRGTQLPVDHAHALGSAVAAALPWFAGEAAAGLHLVHAAASGNGWISPEDEADGLFYLSRRSRLQLRLPRARLAAARELAGTTLAVAGHDIVLGEPAELLLSPITTLYARHVIDQAECGEPEFLDWVAAALQEIGIRAKRMLCGRSGRFVFPDGACLTHSLMIADLDFDAGQRLQRRGLGPGRHHGFGLFVPHKGIHSL